MHNTFPLCHVVFARLFKFVQSFEFTRQRRPDLHLLGRFAELALQRVNVREPLGVQACHLYLALILVLIQRADHLLQIPLIFIIIDIHGPFEMPIQQDDFLLKFLITLEGGEHFVDLLRLLSHNHLFLKLLRPLQQLILLSPFFISHWVSIEDIRVWDERLLYWRL